MANPFFNNFNSKNEQDLLHNLVSESIQIYGHDIYYIPRNIMNRDGIYTEDRVSEYNNHYEITMYIKSFESYGGDGTFLSRFNLEIRDQMVFSIAQRDFETKISPKEGILRPQEGDLIYSKMFKRLFVVHFTDKMSLFYPLGTLPLFDLTCEVFEYSNEKLRTGIPEIDEIENKYSFDENNQGISTDIDDDLLNDLGKDFIIGQYEYEEQLEESYSSNKVFEDETEGLIDWSEKNPFEEGSPC